jgi:hypothetical protein
VHKVALVAVDASRSNVQLHLRSLLWSLMLVLGVL